MRTLQTKSKFNRGKTEDLFPIGISILIRAFVVEFVQSADWEYETCRPRNCTRGPNIGYPFYIEDDKNDTSFCGYPGFNVACKNDKPVYATSRSNYIVEDIFYEERSFRLVNAEATYNSPCLSPDSFFAFDRSSFEFGHNFVDLYLFYHCNDSFPENYTQNLIACASNATHRSYAVLNTGKNEINCSAMPCESYVAAPVEVQGGQDNQTVESIDYTKLLENGFTLEWSAAINDLKKLGYRSKKCSYDTLYYRHPKDPPSVPSDRPPSCEVMQLPSFPPDELASAESDLLLLLTSNFTIELKVSDKCLNCRKRGGLCLDVDHDSVCKLGKDFSTEN
ncbi:hypothetical protein RJ639_008407 [Escallonia herrerae]|uniref:non-specific serine/threonine protein kinase n=1 Tax=Escallonia herrerae TaxID=1293975 RepID=A0AA88VT78_9ASTE|nr:hypothetical protein RJ639_008407 [Escallonia herrerae]